MEIPAYILFLASFAIGYSSRWKIYLGPVDPMQAVAISEAVWVVTVNELALAGIASPLQARLFTSCLVLWWASWAYGAWCFGPSYRRSITEFWRRIAAMPAWMSQRLLILYSIGFAILAAVTIANGGGGDNRQVIMKLLKPMESVTTLLVPVVLFQLLVSKARFSKPMLVAVLLGLIVTGGKSAILSLLIPVTGAALIGRVKLRVRAIAALGGVSFIGVAASIMVNYHITNPLDVITYLYLRISLDADVYLLSLNNDLLSQTETTSLTAYLLGPLIKLLFLPIHVDTNIGSQIGSLLRGEDTVNGPNPHWPIVLLAYGQSVISAILLSMLAFPIVVSLKLRLTKYCLKRTWALWATIPLTSFALLYPQTFFADPSFPLIYLLQACILSVILFVVLTPPSAKRKRIVRMRNLDSSVSPASGSVTNAGV